MRAVALALVAALPAGAAEVELRMLNRGADGAPMVFEPAFVRIAPGDTVVFRAADPGHNAETIAGMIPAGAEPFRSRLNADFAVTLTVPGIYGIRCLPHFVMGMVALVQVGDADAPPEAPPVRLPARAAERMTAALAEARAR